MTVRMYCTMKFFYFFFMLPFQNPGHNVVNGYHPPQVRHLHQIILPQFQRDFISLLPKELALYVLSFLLPKDLLRAAQTCKYWNILAADNLLWREKCREAGIDDHMIVMDRRRRKGTSISHMSPFKVGGRCLHDFSVLNEI